MKNIFVILLIIFTSSCSKNWSYDGKRSPQNWGDLKKEFKFCKIGFNQSPINVEGEFKGNQLKFFYKNSEVKKTRQNHVAKIEFDGHDFISRGKKKYFTRELFFHHPSEHLINTNQYSLELQIYHKSEDEQWLALAILMEIGESNPNFDHLIKVLETKNNEEKLDLSKIVKENDKIFFYDGSFTTPPCKEGVKWYVLRTPLYISKEQMNKIIDLGIFVKSNARPVQEFNSAKY